MEILSIALLDLKKLMREKTPLVITFLMPLILIVVMGSINFGGGEDAPKLPVGIVNYDTGKASAELIEEIKKDKTIYVNLLDENKLIDDVKSSSINVGFIIPDNFSSTVQEGRLPEIKVLKLPSSSDFMVIEAIINNAFTKLGAKEYIKTYFDEKLKAFKISGKDAVVLESAQRLDENLQGPALVSVETKTYSKNDSAKEIDPRSHYTLGFTIMFVMWGIVFSAGEILQEKKSNTWDRLNITPAGKFKIYAGKILGTFTRGWVQVLFLILFSKYVMGIEWGDSIPATIAVVSVFILSVNSFGIFMASMLKTNAQLGAVSSVIITCSSMLAGCYWPLEIVPDYMQTIAKVFPQYWAMKGLSATAGNQGIEDVINSIVVLSGMGILFLVLTLLKGRFSFEIGNRKVAAAK